MILLVFLVSFGLLPISSLSQDVDRRAAPWWDALEDEQFYRQCQSSCTKQSRGVRTQVTLCDDTEVCRGLKRTLDEVATEKCLAWQEANVVPELTFLGEGRRFKHEPAIGNWISCAIFCKTDHRQWYSPRRELGRQAFFQDGIWCHNNGREDFYCQKNLCLPEGYEVNDAVRSAQLAMESDLENVVIDDEVLAL
ncbi:hypothetical protein TCAL_01165 [Tigriopus californicus]|uniref:ADAMTS cysteine-rich domain-containing protein n=1 Tax=Tigriopus californicus TaxID=6832 RepID=A0A553NY64_TIGCA|nr:uncharacterized protein LOC131886179 [Tigriopus californicus]TRY70360.1 hypothetical protein TCAL_01165 [Tigriopus californicus]|eukprot:TCALIF_01165-PA protein Name:"Protein of unknown function" AED:0.38 eAED:0.38 QI:109/1/1/1/1/1/2/49/193